MIFLLLACSGDEPALEWGEELLWGDLHAHSAWSYDSCEDPEAECAARSDAPAGDFYANAAAEGLDFAALTDHAEADRLLPEGEGGRELAIWAGQQATVEGSGDVLGLLGFEWTAFQSGEGGVDRGSHRTVLVEGAEGCAGARVSGRLLPGGRHERDFGEAIYLQDTEAAAQVAPALWRSLAEAAEGCPELRWLSFAHHSAWKTPQQTSWALEENHPTAERLVEIYSEHGSSECEDLTEAGCGWRVNPDNEHVPEGSVERALNDGWKLGLVAGTDSHDARPGSLSDGPGPVGHWEDTDGDGALDSPMRHYTPGGLTGVWAAERSRGGLFDALEARLTVASSGPRPDVRVALVDREGRRWPPGAEVPLDRLPGEIEVELIGLQADELRLALRSEGQTLEESEGAEARYEWSPGGPSWAMIRAEIAAEGTTERLWISPWFAVEEEERGCSTAPASAVGLWACLALLCRIRPGRARLG